MKSVQRVLILAGALSAALIVPAAAQTVDAIVAKLRSTGTLTMGYRETLLPTSYLDDNKKPTGYAIEMCHRIIDDAKKYLYAS